MTFNIASKLNQGLANIKKIKALLTTLGPSPAGIQCQCPELTGKKKKGGLNTSDDRSRVRKRPQTQGNPFKLF